MPEANRKDGNILVELDASLKQRRALHVFKVMQAKKVSQLN